MTDPLKEQEAKVREAGAKDLKAQQEWLGAMRTVLGDKKKDQIKAQLEQHLVNTGRAADPKIADPAAAEKARAAREDMVQNLVADRSEISSNVASTEEDAAKHPRKQHDAAVAAHKAAEKRKVAADKAVVAANADIAKVKPPDVPSKDQNDKLAAALAEQAEADLAVPIAFGAIAPAKALNDARDTEIALRVADHQKRIRDSAETTNPVLRASLKADILKAASPPMSDSDAEAAVTLKMQQEAEKNFYRNMSAPLLKKEREAAAQAAQAKADAAAAAFVNAETLKNTADDAVKKLVPGPNAKMNAGNEKKAKDALTKATTEATERSNESVAAAALAATAASTAATLPTDDESKARAELRLAEIAIEHTISEKIEQRIAAEVDQMKGGVPQRIVHPMTRVREIEGIVAAVAEEYGYTNLAHFISRHGAPRHNPDAGQTVLGTGAKDDATKPETIRQADDAAARVITGVGPDQAEYDPAKRAPLMGAKGQGTVKVKAADGSALPDETVNVPVYTEVGGQVAAASSQHASAKAALFMLDEAAAQAARFASENPDSAGKNFTVLTGKEDVGGSELGSYPEQDGLGASYAVNESSLTTDADKLKANKSGATPLGADTVEKRRGLTTKTVGAQAAEAVEIPDTLHGGFNLMTLFTKTEAKGLNVQQDDQAIGNAARKKAKDDFLANEKANPASALAVAQGKLAAAQKEADDFKLNFTALAAAKKATGPGAAADVVKYQQLVDAAGTGATIKSMLDKRLPFTKDVDKALADATKLANDAGEAASTQAQTLAAVNKPARDAALKDRHDEGAQLLATQTANAHTLRTAATSTKAKQAVSAQEADDTLAATVPAKDLPTARTELKALADTAASTQAAQAAASKQLADAQKHLADAEAMATHAPAQAAAMLSKAQAALGAVDTELLAAKAAQDRITQLMAAGTHKDTPRLQEELLRANAALGLKEIEKLQAEDAKQQVQAAKNLVDANQAVNLARQASDKAADAQAKTPSDKLLADAEAAKLLLADKRKERDAARAALAAHLGPNHPALADPIEEAAQQAETAAAAKAKADTAATEAAAPLQAKLKALVPGGDAAKTLALQTKFSAAADDSAQLLADEAAVKKAEAVEASIADRLKEIAREREVLAKGEGAVLAEELAKEWAPKTGESPADYEKRLTAQRDLIKTSAAEAAAENLKAQKANAAAQKDKDDAQAAAALKHTQTKDAAALLAQKSGEVLTPERMLAIQQAQAKVDEAKAVEAAATKARDEAKKVSDRLAAELATRAALDEANSSRADAEAAARIAMQKAKANPGDAALATAAALAEHTLLVAARTADLVSAKADLDEKHAALTTAQARNMAGKKAYDTASAKPAAAQSDAEKKLITAWTAVAKRLGDAQAAAQAAHDAVENGAHKTAVDELAKAKKAAP